MSRKNGHLAKPLTPPSPAGEGKDTIVVAFTEDEVRLLINVIQATPVQGNLQSLPQMIDRLKGLQEKLATALTLPSPVGEGKTT
jgi:hypothetical protein